VPFCSELGRPSIDPELMIRMLIVGYSPKVALASATN
jgi:transposase